MSVYKAEEETNWMGANDSKVVIGTDPALGECYIVLYKKSLCFVWFVIVHSLSVLLFLM